MLSEKRMTNWKKMSSLSKTSGYLNKTNLELKKTNDKIDVNTRTIRLYKTNVELK